MLIDPFSPVTDVVLILIESTAEPVKENVSVVEMGQFLVMHVVPAGHAALAGGVKAAETFFAALIVTLQVSLLGPLQAPPHVPCE